MLQNCSFRVVGLGTSSGSSPFLSFFVWRDFACREPLRGVDGCEGGRYSCTKVVYTRLSSLLRETTASRIVSSELCDALALYSP